MAEELIDLALKLAGEGFDEHVDALVKEAENNETELALAVTRTPASTRDLAVAGVATDMLSERDVARSRLAGAGALVVDAPASRLATRCVSAYLRLKATARI